MIFAEATSCSMRFHSEAIPVSLDAAHCNFGLGHFGLALGSAGLCFDAQRFCSRVVYSGAAAPVLNLVLTCGNNVVVEVMDNQEGCVHNPRNSELPLSSLMTQ